MEVLTFEGGPFAENTYLLVPEAGGATLVDPGFATPGALEALAERGRALDSVLLTHAHIDHVEGLPAVRAAWPDVPIRLHPDDLPLYQRAGAQAAAFGLDVGDLPELTADLTHGETIGIPGGRLEVRFAPGHAPGHVVFYEPSGGWALVGDVVFRGSIGRTDLPGGDFQALMASIRREVLSLPDETVLHPGHGPSTTVGFERVGNPFLVPHYGGELA